MSFIKPSILLFLVSALSASAAIAQDTPQAQPAATKPFQLGIEQKEFLEREPPAQTPQYPQPQMVVPQTPNYAPAQPRQAYIQQQYQPPPNLNGGIQQGPPPRQMMQPQVPQEGVLPPQFLGRWQVMGARSKVEAQPQFQQGAEGAFAMNTQNIWMIQGNPQQGYSLSTDQGVSTSLLVQSTGDTAILKYQHQVKNTMAQEAVVMQLNPGGATFNGLERISIVKPGEGVRAKVEYNLVGHRQ